MNTAAPTWMGINLVKNRWIFPLLGAITTLIGGAAYAFSVFIRPLEEEFGWSRTETVAAFSVAMLVFGATMVVGGYLVDKYGPRWPFLFGAVFLVAAQFLSAQITSVGELVLAYGVLGGIGLGFTYAGATVAVNSRWFPDRKGLAIGSAIAGFGLGSLVSAPLWTAGIEAFGWRTTYMITGVVFAVTLTIIGTILRFPPSNWHFVPDQGWRPIETDAVEDTPSTETVAVDSQDFTLAEAVRTRQLWLTGLMFLLAIFGGLMAVSQLAAFARDLPPAGIGLSAATAATVVMVMAIFNGSGRPIWGTVSDRIGIRSAYMAVILIMILAMVVLAFTQSLPMLLLGSLLVGFAFGGTLALNPILATAFFGPSFIARIYGLIFFLGFGLGGLFGPMVGGFLRDTTGDYRAPFLSAAATAVVALGVAFFLVPGRGQERLVRPRRQGQEQKQEQ